jgi:hypothetical protein
MISVLDSFSTAFEGLPYDSAKGDVILLPPGLAKALVRGGVVELVGADTPLHRQRVQWR